jgi:hypothetical protein
LTKPEETGLGLVHALEQMGIPFVEWPFGDQVRDATTVWRGYTYEDLQESGRCP